MGNQPLNELAIFRIAFRIESDEVREDYLRQACGNNQILYARVTAILKANTDSQKFLEPPPDQICATIDHLPIAERPGTQIGPYKLYQEIGEGGMGVVYMALQKEPVRRKVALKIIKPGMGTREVIARFAAEEQALAMMDHPNIARVFDAGTTETGRPYFVMELVNGVPITQYCDDNHSTTRQRLELFTLVCHAVQHAHQKGIIHRDIKPSNILVTLHDGVPVPKVIDFGIAKAINQELTSKTMATGVGHMIGTPLYMSPEQAERSGLDIDTRSDIYSLGVLLYELLTGSTPFESDQFKDVGLDEVRRLIREQEPPRPSTRISTMGKAATTVSEHRRTNPVELSNSLRHELDWIVMKALEKDRTRRYESANDFARDIRRYLHDEAVEACPPSTVYRLRKFTRRHQGAVIATTAVSLALILGAGVAAGQAYRATKAEKYAEEQLQIAQDQERLAKQQTLLAKKQKKLAEEAAQRERDLRTEAEAARKQSEAVTSFLVDIFRSPDPERDGRTITVAEMLDKAGTRAETEFKEAPRLRAELLGALADTYLGLGLLQKATELAKKSHDTYRAELGPGNVDTLRALARLAHVYREDDRWKEALPLIEETLQRRKEVLGPVHPDTLASLSELASVLGDAGESDRALRLYKESLHLHQESLGPEHRDTLRCMNNLAGAYGQAGLWNDALQVYENTLRVQEQIFGPEHVDTLATMSNMAIAFVRTARYDDAIRLLKKSLPIYRERLGADHPDTLNTMNSLAGAYLYAGQLDEAQSLFEGALRLMKEKLGADHSSTWSCMSNLARCYCEAGRSGEAIALAEQALEIGRVKCGPQHPMTLRAMNLLAGIYWAAGRRDDAVRLQEQAVTAYKEALGVAHSETAENMTFLASLYWQLKQLDRSIALFEEAIPQLKSSLGEHHVTTLQAMASLGQNYTDAGRLEEAIALLENTLSMSQEKLGPEHAATLLTMNNLAIAYGKADRLADAVQLMRQAVDLWKKTLGPEHPETLDGTMSLVSLYVRQADYASAEPLLIGVHEALTKRQATSPSPANAQKLQAVTALLVQHYTKANQPDKVNEWQEKLDALQSGTSKPESKEN